MSDSAVVEFELDCSPIDQVHFDRAIYSDVVSAGGHDWRMACFPNDVGSFVSVYLELRSEAKNVTATFDAIITDSDRVAESVCFSRRRAVQVHNNPLEHGEYVLSGFARFVHRGDLRDYAGNNGRVTVMCAVSVLNDRGKPTSIAKVPVPPFPTKKGIAALPSDMGDRLGCLLDSAALSDVSFVVGDDQVRAHRAILAAHSPVFNAEFCGHMLETNTPSPTVTVPDMDSETFKAMLRFVYTDSLPAGLGDDDDPAHRSLLAAADLYALDRLKRLCARRLLNNLSVDTVATVLDCAEMYNCPELKAECIEFVLADENFNMVVLTDAFIAVARRFPSLLAEMRSRHAT